MLWLWTASGPSARFIAKLTNKCTLIACCSREKKHAWRKVLNQHVWFPQPLCLSNEDALLIDFRNVSNRPLGKRYSAGGTASSCINQCSSPLRRLRPLVRLIPQHANQKCHREWAVWRWTCAVQAASESCPCTASLSSSLGSSTDFFPAYESDHKD